MTPWNTDTNSGIYWMTDRNNDGDALDESEVTMFSLDELYPDLDSGFLAARR